MVEVGARGWRAPQVILNLAVWFAVHTLFRDARPIGFAGSRFEFPVLTSLHLPALVLAIGAAVVVFRFKVGMIPTLAATPAVGVAMFLL